VDVEIFCGPASNSLLIDSFICALRGEVKYPSCDSAGYNEKILHPTEKKTECLNS